MGVDVPPLKKEKKHRIVITLTGPLDERYAESFKKALNKVIDQYRGKLGKLTPPPKKKPKGSR